MVGVPVAAVDEQVELGGGDRADRHADPFRTTTGERSSSLAGNVEHEVLGTERQLATGRRGAERELATGRRERWGWRSEERSVGNECVSKCSVRWSRYHLKKQRNQRRTLA